MWTIERLFRILLLLTALVVRVRTTSSWTLVTSFWLSFYNPFQFNLQNPIYLQLKLHNKSRTVWTQLLSFKSWNWLNRNSVKFFLEISSRVKVALKAEMVIKRFQPQSEHSYFGSKAVHTRARTHTRKWVCIQFYVLNLENIKWTFQSLSCRQIQTFVKLPLRVFFLLLLLFSSFLEGRGKWVGEGT